MSRARQVIKDFHHVPLDYLLVSVSIAVVILTCITALLKPMVFYPFGNDNETLLHPSFCKQAQAEELSETIASRHVEEKTGSSTNSATENDSDAHKTSDIATSADTTSSSTTAYTSNVEALLQYPELPAGCESVSLTIVLRSMGYDLPLTTIADSYLAIDPSWGDFVTAFGGDPRTGGGTMPPAIVNAANTYLREQDAEARAHDITGTSFNELFEYIDAGYPVLTWTTMYMAEPTFSSMTQGAYTWYTNEHCVVLYGREGDDVLVSDPLEGLVRRDAAEFQHLYEACGSMAAVIS